MPLDFYQGFGNFKTIVPLGIFSSMSDPPYPPRRRKDLGTWGETLVANWLTAQHWRLQAQQWHCLGEK
jgi:hypothetical protein